MQRNTSTDFNTLGSTHYRDNNFPAALEAFKQALVGAKSMGTPELAILHNNLSATYAKLGQYAGALNHIISANTLNPKLKFRQKLLELSSLAFSIAPPTQSVQERIVNLLETIQGLSNAFLDDHPSNIPAVNEIKKYLRHMCAIVSKELANNDLQSVTTDYSDTQEKRLQAVAQALKVLTRCIKLKNTQLLNNASLEQELNSLNLIAGLSLHLSQLLGGTNTAHAFTDYYTQTKYTFSLNDAHTIRMTRQPAAASAAAAATAAVSSAGAAAASSANIQSLLGMSRGIASASLYSAPSSTPPSIDENFYPGIEGVPFRETRLTNNHIDNRNLRRADFSATSISDFRLSFCLLDNAKFDNGHLNNSVILCSSFSSGTSFRNTDVSGLLILFSTCEGHQITNRWLEEKGATNTEQAITNFATLKAMLDGFCLPLNIAATYQTHIDHLLNLLNPLLAQREREGMFTTINRNLLPYVTRQNIDLLKEASESLNTYIRRHSPSAQAAV